MNGNIGTDGYSGSFDCFSFLKNWHYRQFYGNVKINLTESPKGYGSKQKNQGYSRIRGKRK